MLVLYPEILIYGFYSTIYFVYSNSKLSKYQGIRGIERSTTLKLNPELPSKH